jgi:hypothetical protein
MIIVVSVPWRAPCYVHLDNFLDRAQLSAFWFGSVLLTYSVLACSRPAEDPHQPSKFVDYLPVALYCMTTVATLFLLHLVGSSPRPELVLEA